jgi:hypothetical protein
MRGTPELDFRQLFLVKESLALMYQMMQIPQESLIQYEELEALLSFASLASLPTNEWPLTPLDLGTSSKKTKSKTNTTPRESGQDDLLDSSSSTTSMLPDPSSSSSEGLESNQPWMNAYHHGSSLLLYSINYTRAKVLKNRVSIIELTHYVFARQVFFLFSLGKMTQCAEKGYQFITMMYSTLMKRLEEVKRGSAIDDLKMTVLDHRANSHGTGGGGGGGGIGVGAVAHTKSTVDGALHATTLTTVISNPSAHLNESNDSRDKLRDISIMIGLWSVMATIQLIRGCREQFHATLSTPSTPSTLPGGDQSTSPVFLRSRTISGTANSLPASNFLESSPSASLRGVGAGGNSTSASGPSAAVGSSLNNMNESMATKIRDASRSLSDLLFFTKDILLEIFQYQHHRNTITLTAPPLPTISSSDSSSPPPRPLVLYDEYRRLSLDIARDFSGWDNFDHLIEMYPSVFRRPPSQSDDDLLPSILSGNSKPKPTSELVNGNGKQKLFRETIENLEEVRGYEVETV